MDDFIDLSDDQWERLERGERISSPSCGAGDRADDRAGNSAADPAVNSAGDCGRPMDPRLALELEDEREDVEARLQKIQEEVESLLEEQEQLIKRREEINSRLEASAAAAASWAAANNANINNGVVSESNNTSDRNDSGGAKPEQGVAVSVGGSRGVGGAGGAGAGGGAGGGAGAAGLGSVARWQAPFEWDAQVAAIGRDVFGIGRFRSQQREIINAVLCKRDVFVIMPAGGGKSLCYQLPALLSPGISLVVSPLLSLIHDQVMCLSGFGVPAAMLTSTTSKEEERAIYNTLEHGEGLLYVTPEKVARSKRFMSKLEKCHAVGRLSLIAIDEAHCCSQWGHDFRPDYAHLSVLKKQFPKTPMLALTVSHRFFLIPQDAHARSHCGAALTVSAVLIVVLPSHECCSHCGAALTVSAALIVVLPSHECCSHCGAALTVSAALIVVLPSPHSAKRGEGAGKGPLPRLCSSVCAQEAVPQDAHARPHMLKKQFPKTPMLALTATATERVRDDVRDMLQMRRCELFVSSVNRPNLFYEVREKPPQHLLWSLLHASFWSTMHAPSDSIDTDHTFPFCLCQVREKPPGAASTVEPIAHFILQHYLRSFETGTNQPCLSLRPSQVREKPPGAAPAVESIARFILEHYAPSDSGIVYCFSRKECEQVQCGGNRVHSLSPPLASLVWSVAPPLSSPPPSHHSQVASELSLRGIPAAHYHADMDPSHRTHVHVSWSRGEVQVIVGTVSDRVGRGGGKGGKGGIVGSVCHTPYSQQVYRDVLPGEWASGQGWAAGSLHSLLPMRRPAPTGKDGLPARCIVFFRSADLPRQSSMVFAENAGLINLYAMGRYAMNRRECRRTAIFRHFGEEPRECEGMCDICSQGGGGGERTAQQDFTPHARSILEFVQETQSSKEKSLTLLQLTEQWRTGGRGGGGGGGGVGRGNVKAGGKGESESWGSLVKGITKETTEQLITHMLLSSVLREEFQHSPYATNAYLLPGRNAHRVLTGE
ncbi:unnamed protein product [Closterium sp. NIES-64]|nr:unnamed protein product [Closterium sp. NIES-64]